MIILSQDKEKIINFDNMTRVYITFDEGDDYVCIRTETVDSLYEDLGYYKTEARAKEVLQELIEAVSIKEIEGTYKELEIIIKLKSFVAYEMPEK